MATQTITDENFREIYSGNDMVILDFWAAWCGPCQSFGPVFERVSEDFPNVVFGKIDTEVQQKLAAYFTIRSIPTIMIIREELEVFRHSGSLGEVELRKVVEDVQKANMDDVRAKIEAAEAAEESK